MPPITSHPFATLRLATSIMLGASLLAAGCTMTPKPRTDTADASATAATAPTTLQAAIAGPQRTDRARARDVYRHPAQTLQFFGVTPTQTVLEIAPGGGWYTDILAPWLHADGKLYEAEYDSPSHEDDAEEQASRAALARKFAATPALYGGVVIGTLRDGQFQGFDSNATFDAVLTFRNIHNWIKDGQIDANFHAFYAALKPGGVLGVEEHRARPGTTLQQMIDSGYVTEAYVIQHARAAGFELAGSSPVNHNSRDTTQHPNGVWSLPPSYKGGDIDKASFAAIGESDRMTLRFVKPQ